MSCKSSWYQKTVLVQHGFSFKAFVHFQWIIFKSTIKIVSSSLSGLVNSDCWVFVVLAFMVFLMWVWEFESVYIQQPQLFPEFALSITTFKTRAEPLRFCNALIWHSSELYGYFSCVIRVHLISLFKYYLCALQLAVHFFPILKVFPFNCCQLIWRVFWEDLDSSVSSTTFPMVVEIEPVLMPLQLCL